MEKTFTTKSRLMLAFALAVALSIVGHGTAFAHGYGTGSCSVWQSFWELVNGVYCGYQ